MNEHAPELDPPPGPKPVLTVRFPVSIVAAARRVAELDGMSLSAWVRKLVDQEIGHREGKCPTCGHARARAASGT